MKLGHVRKNCLFYKKDVCNGTTKEEKSSTNIVYDYFVLVEDWCNKPNYSLIHNLVNCFMKRLSTSSMLFRKSRRFG